MKDWETFVAEHGWHVRSHYLAAIVGVSELEINRLRSKSVLRRRKKALPFTEIFRLWHSRWPKDHEWPAPQRRGAGGTYEWQTREITLLISLAGRVGPDTIAKTLSERLRKLTGDPKASRSKQNVIGALARFGGAASDLVDGISIREAAAEFGSTAGIRSAIQSKELHAYKIGRLFCIPKEAWEKWKASREKVPDGFIRLASLKEPLSIKSDKLAEFARAGLVPGARCIKRSGAPGPTSQYGTWYIPKNMAKKLVADRRKGRPMPWHGAPNKSNLQATFRLWEKRRHPADCDQCKRIWGRKGAPRGFAEYTERYVDLSRMDKLHLTKKRWQPGLNLHSAARMAACSHVEIRSAVKNRLLRARRHRNNIHLLPKDVMAWRKKGCPTSPKSRSFISVSTARKWYFFSDKELRRFIKRGLVSSFISKSPATWNQPMLAKVDLRLLREKEGFTIDMASKVVGVCREEVRRLMRECGYRVRKKNISIDAVYIMREKYRDRTYRALPGVTLQEASERANASLAWVRARIADGTVKVLRDTQDRRRLYLTEPMMKRLLAYQRGYKRKYRHDGSWLTLDQACIEAGVTVGTFNDWYNAGEIATRQFRHGLRYSRETVRKRAKQYWAQTRWLRAKKPAWLIADAANENDNHHKAEKRAA